ncbi:30S ribosomal protein S16 [Candidatus Kaiserbacteria bacterium]|nr:30S ribosomal protein S16 [Candidatus Kaiserbacteria bacterium]
MMLKMRLQRVGRKHSPAYRVLIVDSRQGPKSGKYIDQVGSYEPKEGRITIDGEKAKEWIAKGVQVSGTVHNMLIDRKIIEGKKINVLPRKSPIKKEDGGAPVAEAPAVQAPDATSAEAPETSPGEVSVEETPSESASRRTAEETPVEPVGSEPS